MVVITIDTAKDSQQEIRKAVRYLQDLVGERVTDTYTNPLAEQPETATPSASEFSGMMGMFDAAPEDSEAPSQESSETSDKNSDGNDSFIEIVEY